MSFLVFIVSLIHVFDGAIKHDTFWIIVACYEMLVAIFMRIVDKESEK